MEETEREIEQGGDGKRREKGKWDRRRKGEETEEMENERGRGRKS